MVAQAELPIEPSLARKVGGPLLVNLAILALVCCQFSAVRANNFGGYDEWLIRWLTTHGILDSPYSNRPFNFLWTWPGGWLTPYGFLGYHIVHVAYVWLSGCCVFWIVRRLLPADPALAFLAGVFTALWAPTDLARLSSVQMSICSGFTFGMLLAIALWIEAWLSTRPLPLIASALLAWVTVRGYEATLPLLFAASLVVLVSGRGPRSPRRLWSVVWLGTLAIAASQTVLPMLVPSDAVQYQREVWGGLDLNPVGLTSRLLRQFSFHLLPAASPRPGELGAISVVLSVLAFVGFSVAVSRIYRSASGLGRSALVGVAAGGLGLAALGYGVFLASAADVGATRMQFLSGPGIAVFLAATVRLIGGSPPARGRRGAEVLLAAWLVAAAAGRTAAMQRAWDRFGVYPGQQASLIQLTQLAPDLEAGTLVILLDRSRSWPATFGFRHAIEILYPKRATGYVLHASDLLYPTAFGVEGVVTVPWSSIQRGWGVQVTRHSYQEVVVARLDANRRLTLLDQWPPELPPLPPDARYAPRSRIRPLLQDVPERALLSQ